MPGPFVLSWSPARTRGRSARAASAIGGSAASLNRPIAFDGGYHSSGLGARNVRLGSNCDLPVRLGHVEPVSGQGRMSKTAQLQRPLPNTMLRIVASGEREDPPPERAQTEPS